MASPRHPAAVHRGVHRTHLHRAGRLGQSGLRSDTVPRPCCCSANSALLHVVPWRSAKVTRVLCGIDYSNIFLIIAGTNTPVLFALSPAIRRPYLTVIWVTAAIGTILHIVWLRTPNWVFTTVYVVLGLAPVTLIPQLWTAPAVGPAATILIACGGAAYIAGAVCFALRKPNPVPGWFEFHEVFHLGTVIGYACHVVAIYLIVCAL